ncbi:MAG: 4Fe-4S binding protein [Thermoplasmata archaeon]|nr:4Fe-4S binding protein [Thermoplasmata archaeon]
MIGVDSNRCLHCGCCAGTCPQNAIFMNDVALEFNDYCNSCGTCVRICPVGALSMGGD